MKYLAHIVLAVGGFVSGASVFAFFVYDPIYRSTCILSFLAGSLIAWVGYEWGKVEK